MDDYTPPTQQLQQQHTHFQQQQQQQQQHQQQLQQEQQPQQQQEQQQQQKQQLRYRNQNTTDYPILTDGFLLNSPAGPDYVESSRYRRELDVKPGTDESGAGSIPDHAVTATSSHHTDDDLEDQATRVSKKRKQRRFHQLFTEVPNGEHLVCRFSCAYVTDKGALIQGHLYVSRNWVNFYSNLLGFKKTISVPFRSVEAITKEKTARFFPNAVGIKTETSLYIFGSLISRDNTFQLLVTFFERSKGNWGTPEKTIACVLPVTAEIPAVDDLPEELAQIVPTIIQNTAKSTQVDEDESLFEESSDEDFVDEKYTKLTVQNLGQQNSSTRRQARTSFRIERKVSPSVTPSNNGEAIPLELSVSAVVTIVCTVCILTLLMCASLLTVTSTVHNGQRINQCFMNRHNAAFEFDPVKQFVAPATDPTDQLNSFNVLEDAIEKALDFLKDVRHDVEILRDDITNLKFNNCGPSAKESNKRKH